MTFEEIITQHKDDEEFINKFTQWYEDNYNDASEQPKEEETINTELYDKCKPGLEKGEYEEAFDILVPSEGKADTIAGELIRALARIDYRYFNDGDYCFTGYGKETCGGSISFIINEDIDGVEDACDKVQNAVYNYAPSTDKVYETFLEELKASVIKYLLDNPEVFTQKNGIDSREMRYEGDYAWDEYDTEVDIGVTLGIAIDTFDGVADYIEADFSATYPSLDIDFDGNTAIIRGDYDEVEQFDIDFFDREVQDLLEQYSLAYVGDNDVDSACREYLEENNTYYEVSDSNIATIRDWFNSRISSEDDDVLLAYGIQQDRDDDGILDYIKANEDDFTDNLEEAKEEEEI